MKYIIILLGLFINNAVKAQNFSGLTDLQKAKILKTKVAIPLPTWLPEGFTASTVITRTAKVIPIQDRILSVTYTRKLLRGKVEQFTIEAGFDGIGDMAYENGIIINSGAGKIELYYEPMEEIEGGKKQKVKGLVQTEWFDVKNLAFHVVFSLEPNEEKKSSNAVVTTLANAKKILASIQILK